MDAHFLALQRQLVVDPDNIEQARALAICMRRSKVPVENTSFEGWLTVLKAGSFPEQVEILNRLYALGPLAEFARPTLIQCLKSVNPELRQRAAEVIGEVGVASQDMTSELFHALAAVGSELVPHPIIGVEVVPAQGDPAIVDLMRLIDDQDATVRQSVFQILTRLSRESAPALLPFFAHENRKVRHVLVEVLVAARERAVPALVLAMTAPRGRARRFAGKVFARMDDRVIPALLEILEYEPDEWRCGAVRGLLALGSEARKALPQLRRHGAESGEALRVEIRLVFEMLGLKAPF